MKKKKTMQRAGALFVAVNAATSGFGLAGVWTKLPASVYGVTLKIILLGKSTSVGYLMDSQLNDFMETLELLIFIS